MFVCLSVDVQIRTSLFKHSKECYTESGCIKSRYIKSAQERLTDDEEKRQLLQDLLL